MKIYSKLTTFRQKFGTIFTGKFYEIFEEENTILINNTIINIKDIEKWKNRSRIILH